VRYARAWRAGLIAAACGVPASASVELRPVWIEGQSVAPGLVVDAAVGPRVGSDGAVVAWVRLAPGVGVTREDNSAVVLTRPGSPPQILLRANEAIPPFAPSGTTLRHPTIDALGRLTDLVSAAKARPSAPTTRWIYSAVLGRWTTGAPPLSVDPIDPDAQVGPTSLVGTPGGVAVYTDRSADGDALFIERGEGPERIYVGGATTQGRRFGPLSVSADGRVAFLTSSAAQASSVTLLSTFTQPDLAGPPVQLATTDIIDPAGTFVAELGGLPSVDDRYGVAYWCRGVIDDTGQPIECIARYDGKDTFPLVFVGQGIDSPVGPLTISRLDRSPQVLPTGRTIVRGFARDGAGTVRDVLLSTQRETPPRVLAVSGAWPIEGNSVDAVARVGFAAGSATGRVVYRVWTAESTGSPSREVLLTVDRTGRTEEIVRTGQILQPPLTSGGGPARVRGIVFDGSTTGTVSGAGAIGQIAPAPGGGGVVAFAVELQIEQTVGTPPVTRPVAFSRSLLTARVGCPGDFDDDGVRDSTDLADFLAAYFGGSLRADADGSGTLTPTDLFRMIRNYLGPC
jgi:hypothetical protein